MLYNFTLLEKILLKKNIIPHPIIDSLSLVIAGRTIQVSVKLGIFESLKTKPMKIDEIAMGVNISFEGALVIIDTLENLGYVKLRNDKKYELTTRSLIFLTKNSKASLINTIRFSDYVFGALNNLEENIKRGGPKKVNLSVFTKKEWGIFNKAMVEIASANFKEIVNKIPLSKKYKKLLDLGGSHGIHSIAFCSKLPSLKAIIMDLKPTQKQAQQIITHKHMLDKVSFRVGDFLKDDLGKNFDVVLGFNIIHGLNPTTNQKLTHKIYNALNPKGIYIVMDQIKDARGKSQLSKLIATTMGVMLFNQAGGRTYTFNEVSSWMNKTGFRKIEMKKLRDPGSALIIGSK